MTREELEIILSKIAQIKENEQKVFDAGFASGFEKGLTIGTITFTSGQTFRFERGMTWREFSANTEYNPNNAITIDGDYVRYYGWEYVKNFDTGEDVYATDLIDEKTNYYFSTPA